MFKQHDFHPLPTAALLLLDACAALITLGGLFDIFTPRLPANHRERCARNERAAELVRELLRALGGCLVAVGLTTGLLVNGPVRQGQRWPLGLILVLVLPSEGLNAWGMYRVRSPYYVPLIFVALAIAGVGIALAAPH